MKLNELRRNPSLNPRLDLIANLDSLFKDDTTRYYIHFSDYPKIGINPTSEFETPLGIYAYPLTEMENAIRTNMIPFAGDRKYAVAFSAKGNIVLGSKYSDADLANDIER